MLNKKIVALVEDKIIVHFPTKYLKTTLLKYYYDEIIMLESDGKETLILFRKSPHDIVTGRGFR